MKEKLQTALHKSGPIRFGASPCMLLPRFTDAKINNGSWVANGTAYHGVLKAVDAQTKKNGSIR